ncbi:GDSL family lipase [Pedobacter polaris]|uniref:GDSL family lipase n=1 Tax=Pedobacter polaris TaxID=2571273 RepID=A0A4U1CLE7_9SPHI|nr:GDSL-type esterase/lipase family protein [Pedobacter polaris]TKC08087.1 GDSL family lipase [Pedobacter polaris]
MYWYEEEVRSVESKCAKLGHVADVLFYGSSTIRLWDNLEEDFLPRRVVNLGFGGSTLASCVWFFDRLMNGFAPKALVVYAGDNDLGDGRHPEEILIFFQQLMAKCSLRFGDIPCYFVSLKPSPARWHMAEQFKYTNNLIESEIIRCDTNWRFINLFKGMLDRNGLPFQEMYADDGLHLSTTGYVLWRQLIGDALAEAFPAVV